MFVVMGILATTTRFPLLIPGQPVKAIHQRYRTRVPTVLRLVVAAARIVLVGDAAFVPNHATRIHDREAKGDVRRGMEKERGKHELPSTCLLIAFTGSNALFTC